MIIQPRYAPLIATTARSLPAARQVSAAAATTSADSVTISRAAREALALSNCGVDPSVATRLEEIKSKGALAKTAQDMDYLYAHDAKLTAIRDKDNLGTGLTSAELDYQQKTIGFVNTMAFLSSSEKQMYDDMVATGNSAAAAGLGEVAFLRGTMGHTAGGAGGMTYDPINTEVTAANIANYFSHTIIDPTGNSAAQFQALTQYLETRQRSPA